ncbi:hypothetical protein [uncultured Prevotella sp.]|uniref:hypothetical protein n=1 Tax=uncultured Prevotella sp. TaxID=159272 RepID=UPI0025EC91DC|nr:hypothetical protein [uncultured Prevotella sp.]
MAKFSHYYLKYKLDDIFAQEHKAERQKLFGEMLEKDDSISFVLGEDENKKHYKHMVKHLRLNHDIIVMRIANDSKKDVIQDFKKMSVRHEPPCYVIIDNREHCRRVAIQRNKDAWASTDSVAKVMTTVLDKALRRSCYIGISMHPQYYPKDFYKAWRMHQHHTSRLWFGLTEGEIPQSFRTEPQTDDTIMGFALEVNEELQRKKYRTELVLSSAQNNTPLFVDEDSVYIRNLVNFHALTGSPIVIETSDGARFTCFIDDEEDSANIITSEMDRNILDILFGEAEGDVATAESKVMEFVNRMKYEVDDNEQHNDNANENVA